MNRLRLRTLAERYEGTEARDDRHVADERVDVVRAPFPWKQEKRKVVSWGYQRMRRSRRAERDDL